jgi:hypothetical protein
VRGSCPQGGWLHGGVFAGGGGGRVPTRRAGRAGHALGRRGLLRNCWSWWSLEHLIFLKNIKVARAAPKLPGPHSPPPA